MSIRRRSTAAVGLAVAAALSLSACGSGASDDSAESGAGSDKKAAVATGGKDFADAAKKTAAYGTDAKAGQFPRTLTHAMGTTELKSAPKRVVVLDVGEFDNVVSLGVKPVGYAPSEGDAAIPSYLKKDAGNPKNVGTINNLNLEAIAGLKPDLILGSQLRAADKYDRSSPRSRRPCSPSVRASPGRRTTSSTPRRWTRPPRRRASSTRTRRRPTKLGEDIGPDKPTISMVRYLPDRIRLYAKASFIGTILEDAGLPRPKNQQINDLAAEISPEKIDEADADWIFTGVYGDPKTTKRDTAQSNPLWKNLKAVKEGRAKDVPDETWYLGLGVTAANLVLDDLRADLVK